MNILVIGGGGREHALAWKLARSPRVARVFVAPGNAGTAREPELANVQRTAIEDQIAFAQQQKIALTVVGPEAPLAAGIVDAFHAAFGWRGGCPEQIQSAVLLAHGARYGGHVVFGRADHS